MMSSTFSKLAIRFQTKLVLNKIPVPALFLSVLVITSANAGELANPIPALTSKVAISELTPEAIAALGVQKENYIGPNEMTPIRMLPVTSVAKEGTYLGVGTERALITAALNPQISFLIIADRDPRVVLFNQINQSLLRMANDRLDYLNLRLKSSFEEWNSRLNAPSTDTDDVELLQNRNAFDWWTSVVRIGDDDKTNSEGNMKDFNSPLAELRYEGDLIYFKDANYLYDDVLFERVSKHAKLGHVQVTLLSFADEQKVTELAESMKAKGLSLSIFDFSNGWWPSYGFGFDRIQSIVNKLREVATDQTLFLGTTTGALLDHWYKDCTTVTLSLDGEMTSERRDYKKEEGYPLMASFTYFGATFGNLRSQDQWNQFEKTLGELKDLEWPLSKELERVDFHVLPEWRLLDIRSKLIPDFRSWKFIPTN